MRFSSWATMYIGRLSLLVLLCAGLLSTTAGAASAASATALTIVTAPQTLTAGACSGVVRVQVVDSNSNVTRVSTRTIVGLSGASLRFYSDAACSTAISSLRLRRRGSAIEFYFSGTVARTQAITATARKLVPASQTETITAGAATALAFRTQPTDVPTGAGITPAVQVAVTDRYGNTVTSSVATVATAIGTNAGGASLSGTVSLGAVGGVATFGNLSLNAPGVGYTLVALSSGLASATSTAFNVMSSTPTPAPGALRTIPEPLYGVTMDAVDHLADIVTSLRNLSHVPTTRIVFDEFVDPGYYIDPVNQIYPVSYVMGELLDSAYVSRYTVTDYLQRTTDYLDALASKVDIWEVGNEINGEWLGDTASVVAKMQGAYDRVKERGYRAALTLYYNQDCWSRADHEMFTWTEANVPATMKQGLDYVLISYYEDDCNGLQPDWTTVFQRLGAMFPNSRIGFGENGTKYASLKAAYIQRYYSMQVPVPRYIGGHFWWYGKQDFVPWTNPLWTIFNDTIRDN